MIRVVTLHERVVGVDRATRPGVERAAHDMHLGLLEEGGELGDVNLRVSLVVGVIADRDIQVRFLAGRVSSAALVLEVDCERERLVDVNLGRESRHPDSRLARRAVLNHELGSVVCRAIVGAELVEGAAGIG